MPEKMWREVLKWLGSQEEFTAGDVARQFKLCYSGASGVLERLRGWGYLRILGFNPAVHTNPKKGPGGRPRKVYELTDSGRRAIEWGSRKKRSR